MKIFLYFCGKNTDNCHKINHTKNPEVAKQKAYEETKYSSEADCLGMKAWVGLATVGCVFIRFILLQYACRAGNHRAGL